MTAVGYVYIITNKAFGTLYIGVTNDLTRRIWEHQHGMREGFTKRNGLNRLVYYKIFETIQDASLHEKQMKKWNRNWKLRCIMDFNPEWNDLYNAFVQSIEHGSPPARG